MEFFLVLGCSPTHPDKRDFDICGVIQTDKNQIDSDPKKIGGPARDTLNRNHRRYLPVLCQCLRRRAPTEQKLTGSRV
jgi:hypothetical protein